MNNAKMRLFIIMLFFSLSLFGQTEFSQTIDMVGYDEVSAGVTLTHVLTDSSLLIHTGNSCIDQLCFGLLNINQDGEIIWQKVYDDEVSLGISNNSGCMLITEDGNIALTGLKHTDDATIKNYFLMLTNSEGDTLFVNTYPEDGSDLTRVISQFSDGGFLIGGANGTISNRDIRLIRTDSLGVLVWEKSFANDFYSSTPYNIIIDKNEDILISGIIYEEEDSDSDAYFMKLSDSEEGEMIWETFLETDWSENYPECPLYLDTIPNEEAYVGAWCINPELNSNFDEVNIVRKMDTSLNTIWEYNVLPEYGETRFIYNVKSLSDGSFLCYGSFEDYVYLDELSAIYDKQIWNMAWLFKLSPEGELEWERIFYDSDNVHAFRIYDVLQTPDGSIYTVGQTTDSLRVEQEDGTNQLVYDRNVWLVRFDENGCFNGDCGPSSGEYWDLAGKIVTSISSGPSEIGSLLVYPNPSNGVFRLRLSEADLVSTAPLKWRVYDVSGRVVKEGNILEGRSSVDIDLSDSAMGVYCLELYSEEAVLGLERLVVVE